MTAPIPPLAVGRALARRSLDVAKLANGASVPALVARLVDASTFTRCPRCNTSGMSWAVADLRAVQIGCACGWACRVQVDAGADSPVDDPPLPP